MRTFTRLLAVAAMALGSVSAVVPLTATQAMACGTTVDIGYTIFDSGYIKGSGSYTSHSCLAINAVSLVILKNGSAIYTTRVTRYPSEPSSAEFSPKDFRCTTSTYNQFKTKISWSYEGGGGGTKYSNTINVHCG